MQGSDANAKRPAGFMRTDIVRQMMNPLDPYPDLFDRLTTSPYRRVMVQMDRAPEVEPTPTGKKWSAG